MKPMSSRPSVTEFQAYVLAVALRVALATVWLMTGIFLSDTSTYHIRGITSTTFAIAMMLTPWGMLHNLVDKSSYLRPFYMTAAERYGLFDDSSLRWSIALFFGLSLALLFLIFKPRLK